MTLNSWQFFPLVLLISILSSCLPMGLPERFSGQMPQSELAAKQVLMLNSLDIRSDNIQRQKEILGHQFLLGVIPFTNIYFEHTSSDFLEEMTIDSLELEGYDISLTSRSSVAAALAILTPLVIIEPKLSRLSLNAYDLMFLRLIKTGGELQVSFFAPSLNGISSPLKSIRVDLLQSEYRKYAHAIELVQVLSEVLSSKLKNIWHELPGAWTIKSMQRSAGSAIPLDQLNNVSKPIVVISSPKFLETVPKDIAKLFPHSYGFSSLPPYTDRIISRVVQRGLSLALVEQGFSILSTRSSADHFLKRQWNGAGYGWLLETIIKEVTIEQENQNTSSPILKIVLSFSLKGFADKTVQSNFEALCFLRKSPAQGADGFWVVTLEQLANEAVKEFLKVQNTNTATNSTCVSQIPKGNSALQ